MTNMNIPFFNGQPKIMLCCRRWAEMQQNAGVAMVSYPENLNSTGQPANSTPPDQAVFEADKRAVYKCVQNQPPTTNRFSIEIGLRIVTFMLFTE